MIRVRKATLADKPAIFQFIKESYRGRWEYKVPHRWHWQFVNNPYLEENELPVSIAVHEAGRVVGQCNVMMEEIKIGANIVRIGWPVDLFVDPDYRGQGIASELLSSASDPTYPFLAALSMAPISRHILSNIEYVPIDIVSSYRRMIDLNVMDTSSALVNKMVPRGAIVKRGLTRLFELFQIDHLVTRAAEVKLERNDAKLAASFENLVDVAKINRFEKEIDQLWDSISPHFNAVVKRDQKYLNWKYVDKPHVDYMRFIARKSGKISGYVILRIGQPPEPRIGVITDLFVLPSDTTTIMALISHGVTLFKDEKVRSIVVASNVPEYQECFKAFGFEKYKENIPMVRIKKGVNREGSHETHNWLLCKGDHDWDQYPLAKDTP